MESTIISGESAVIIQAGPGKRRKPWRKCNGADASLTPTKGMSCYEADAEEVMDSQARAVEAFRTVIIISPPAA